MDFCIISPTAGLERYAKLSKTHLVLAHIIGDGNYTEFYRQRKAAGDLLILDNGAYESAGLPDTYLVEALRIYAPNVFVLPDWPLENWKRTWHAGINFLDNWSDRFPDVQWLYIPQAEKGDLHGFLESYTEAAQDHRVSWIGIPRSLAYAITDNPLARVDFARMVRKDRPDLKLHAFGMVNGDVHEIPYLAHAGVNSIDSSAPVWRGWNGYDIEEPSWDGKAVDFAATFPDIFERDRHAIILENLHKCRIRSQLE